MSFEKWKKVVSLIDLKVMKKRNDCEIARDCVKRANVVLHVGLCKEIFARKHTATHKPTSAQPLSAPLQLPAWHTSNNRLWSPLGLRPSGAITSSSQSPSADWLSDSNGRSLWPISAAFGSAAATVSTVLTVTFAFLFATYKKTAAFLGGVSFRLTCNSTTTKELGEFASSWFWHDLPTLDWYFFSVLFTQLRCQELLLSGQLQGGCSRRPHQG